MLSVLAHRKYLLTCLISDETDSVSFEENISHFDSCFHDYFGNGIKNIIIGNWCAIDRLVLCNRYQHTVVLIALLARRGHLTPHLEAEGIEAGSWDGPISLCNLCSVCFPRFIKAFMVKYGDNYSIIRKVPMVKNIFVIYILVHYIDEVVPK